MLPVPVKLRIDLPVVAGNPTKIHEHTSDKRHAQNQENTNCISNRRRRFRMSKNPTETGKAPEEGKAYWYRPKQERAGVPTRTRRRNRLCSLGLAYPRIKHAGISARSLLVKYGRSHNIRGCTLVALIRVRLQYGCHCVFPDLATPCDTGLFDCDFSPIRSN